MDGDDFVDDFVYDIAHGYGLELIRMSDSFFLTNEIKEGSIESREEFSGGYGLLNNLPYLFSCHWPTYIEQMGCEIV